MMYITGTAKRGSGFSHIWTQGLQEWMSSGLSFTLWLSLCICWSALSLLSIIFSHCRQRLSEEGQVAGAAPGFHSYRSAYKRDPFLWVHSTSVKEKETSCPTTILINSVTCSLPRPGAGTRWLIVQPEPHEEGKEQFTHRKRGASWTDCRAHAWHPEDWWGEPGLEAEEWAWHGAPSTTSSLGGCLSLPPGTRLSLL